MKSFVIVAIASLAYTTPAFSQTYVPGDSSQTDGVIIGWRPRAEELVPKTVIQTEAASLAATQAKYALAENARIRRQANRWGAAYLALSAIDAAQTCDALSRGIAREGNPLFGKNPSCGKIVGIKAVGSGLLYFLFDYIRDRDPKQARLGAQIAVGIQGAAVGFNMRYTFKGR